MDEDDKGQGVDELLRIVAATKKNSLVPKTRKLYNAFNRRFLLFLIQKFPEHVAQTFADSIPRNRNGTPDKAFIENRLADSEQACPIHLAQLIADRRAPIECFVASLRNRKGAEAGQSAVGSARSAINDLYRTHKIPVPPEHQLSLQTYFKGKKKGYCQCKAQW
jgi:hypothetical protein